MIMSYSVIESFYMLSLLSTHIQVVPLDEGDRLHVPFWHNKLFRNHKGQTLWCQPLVRRPIIYYHMWQ